MIEDLKIQDSLRKEDTHLDNLISIVQ